MGATARIQPQSKLTKALARWARGPLPVRIVAFPSYLWFGMERLEELGLSVRLPKGSKILLAGGWKQHYAQEVDKSLLYASEQSPFRFHDFFKIMIRSIPLLLLSKPDPFHWAPVWFSNSAAPAAQVVMSFSPARPKMVR